MNKIICTLFFLVIFSSAKAQVNLTQGLVAYYPFTSNFNDASGNGLNLTPYNGVQFTTDESGNPNSAGYFDGINDYLELLNNSFINFNDAMTIALNFYPEKNGLQCLLGKINLSQPIATQYNVAFDYSPSPGILFGANPINNGCVGLTVSNGVVNTGGGNIPINQWYCVVATFDKGIMKIYLNGCLIQTKDVGFTTLNQCSNADMRIGMWWNGDNQWFKGKIDNIRMYNRAINADEVSALCGGNCLQSPCNNWLNTPSQPSFANVGKINITGNKLTLEALINRTSFYANGQLTTADVISKHASPSDANYALRSNHGLVTTTNGFFVTDFDICPYELNKTYHVATVYDGSTLKFYRDGYLMSTVPATGNLFQNNWNTLIGYLDVGTLNENFVGYINEARIWNVARTQNEIKTYMNGSLPNPTTQPGLLAYYTFDDLLNKQGNSAFNATLQGAASINQTNPQCELTADSCGVELPEFCTGTLGNPIVNIDFGSGATNPGPQISTLVPGASTSYNFASNASGNPPANVILDGSYALVTGVPSNGAWHVNVKDHTGNPNGYMAFFNSAPTPGEFYRQTINGLCAGTTYEFAAWVANAINRSVLPTAISPNITFKIIDPNTQAILGNYNTGDIAATAQMIWKQYSLLFKTPAGVSSVILILSNNNVGGGAQPGNDLAIDDITFRPCGPTTTAAINLATVCNNAPFNLTGNISTGLTNPAYQWQISSNNGNNFTNISGANTLNYAHSGLAAGNYQFQLLSAESGNINSPSCRFVSNKVSLTVTQCTNDSIIINTYTPVLALNPCENKITVEDASTFNPGDTVLIIQMKGAVIDSSNTASFGAVTDYKSAGNYEFNYVKSKTGNIIELLNNITRSYEIPNGKVQLIRVPYYDNITVTKTITCLPWDGRKGGVTALNVKNKLELNANIDVTGKGFSGGKGLNTNLNEANCYQNQYYYPTPSKLAARKGESIAELSNNRSSGKGPLASAGGGGLDHNSGGGGGSNGTRGGLGGYQLYECNNSFFDNRGIAGIALLYNNAANKIFLAGGGGAGHCNNGFINPGHSDYSGGNGGGIVLINADIIAGNNNSIIAKGDSAYEFNGSGDETHDGMGGGGAGGTVLLAVNNFTSNTIVNITGGKGGDMHAALLGGRIGPGGGGAGGVIWFKQAVVPANITIINPGARNGYLLQGNNDPHGAMPGTQGINLFNLQIPVDIVPFKKSIDSVKITTTKTTCTSFDFKGVIYPNNAAITTWQWNFGDNQTAGTQNTNHTYNTNGSYKVKLAVADMNGCVAADSTTVAVIPSSSVITNNDTTICIGQSVQLQTTGATSYSWDPITGLSNSNIANPVATPTATQQYIVTGTNPNGCTGTDTVTITIEMPPIVQTIADTTICLGQSVQLLTTGGIIYYWSPASDLSDNTIASPIANPSASQQYTVTGTSATGCSNTDVVTITIEPNPVITTSNDTTICEGSSVLLNTTGGTTYIWSPASNLSNTIISNPIATPATTREYTVTGYTANGCSGQDVVTITINPKPTIAIINDTAICKNTSVMLTVSGGDNYQWQPSPTLSNTVISNPIATPSLPTTYYVTVTDIHNCSNADSVKVSIKPSAVFTVTPNSAVCSNAPFQLNASGGNSYLWSPAALVSNATISNPTTTASTTTTYSVTITENTCNESATLNTTITISPALQITATKSNDIDCSVGSATLSATGATQFEWSPATGLNNNKIATPVASPAATQQYIVKGSNDAGCIGYDTITVFTDFSDAGFYNMPSAFTPNGDGINDCYGIKYWGVIQSIEFSIFNRWGERIFYTNNPTDCWNGRHRGQKADAGNYVYHIKATTTCGKVDKKGNVVLIR